MENNQLINELVRFYYDYEFKQGLPLSVEEVTNTIQNLLNKNCYHIRMDERGLAGYIESWNVNTDQLGRILIGDSFDVGVEDIQTGPIVYIANLVIRPDLRGTDLLQDLVRDMYDSNHDAENFVWHQRKSHHAPIRIYSRFEMEYFTEKGKVS